MNLNTFQVITVYNINDFTITDLVIKGGEAMAYEKRIKTLKIK